MVFRRSLLDHFTIIPTTWVHDGWIAWMSVLWSDPLFVPVCLSDYRVHAAQQLGVGKTSFFARTREIRRVQRIQYANVAKEFEDLLEYVEKHSSELEERWNEELRRTIGFLRARAHAPDRLQDRVLFLLRHLRSYQSLSGPIWRAMLRDLFMGSAEAR
jgi:hypothetical protein